MLFGLCLNKNLFTASMSQLVRVSSTDEIGGYITSPPGPTHTKDLSIK